MLFREVYLDNGSTTMVDPEVIKTLIPYFNKKYGNASSTHSKGLLAKENLEHARSTIAKSLNASDEEIIFTSGGTESNNMALKGFAFSNKKKGNHIITTKVDHKCVLKTCEWLETQGFKITYLDVDKDGIINLKDLQNKITDKTILLSVIHANNEIGTIQNLESIGKICKKANICFHTDACQSYTKVDLDAKKQNLDLITINSHKIHGPKGVGALYVKKGTNIQAWQAGGDHEFGLRAGTENIHGIIGFAKAVSLANKKHVKKMGLLRDKIISNVMKIPDVKLNGPINDLRLCNNINFSFKDVDGEVLGSYLNQKGICSSTGSACSEKLTDPSYVLKAIGLSAELANSSLRLSLSRFNTQDEIDYLLKVLPKLVKKLRKISTFF